MEANGIEIIEQVSASKKLQAKDSEVILSESSKLIALKGKKVGKFALKAGITEEIINATLGPTGNLRAPTLRVGKTIIVGFNEEVYKEIFA